MNNDYRNYPYFVVTPDDDSIYRDAQEAAEAFSRAKKRPHMTQVMVMTAPGMGYQVAGVNANGEAFLNLLDFQSSQMTQDFQSAYRQIPCEPKVTDPVQPAERPYFSVSGNSTKFYDAPSAAQAFYDAGNTPSTQVLVMKGVGYGHEVAGNNTLGQAFLNKLDFQNDAMTKAFHSSWEKLIEALGPRPVVAQQAPVIAPIDPILVAPQAPEPVIAPAAEAPDVPGPIVATPEPEKPAEQAYFSLPGDSTNYYDAKEAATAFHKSPKVEHTSVSVIKAVGIGHEVAGVNGRGEAFLNKLDFQDHVMTKAFQKAYQDILDHEAKHNGPWYEITGDPTKYFDAQEAAKAFQASPKALHSTVMVMSGPGYGFEAAGVNNEGQTYLNQKDFQSNPMQIAFKEAYEEVLANEKAKLAAASPILRAVIDLSNSDSLSTFMDEDLMEKITKKPAVKKHEGSQLTH
jgi:hypothetical protein